VSIATLDAALDGVRLVTADSSVWLAFLTTTDATHDLARHLFGRIAAEDDPLRAELSTITATESMVRPARAGPAEVGRMRAYLAGFPHLSLVPVDLEIATTAAVVRARSNLRVPDALVVATALVGRAGAIVSNDDAWQRRLAPVYPHLRWVGLYEHV
jgi:predicted nucleic acid-binding protein